MYCPRCERSIRSDNIEKVNDELKKKFDRDSLEHGKCPVCNTPLIEVPKKKVQ